MTTLKTDDAGNLIYDANLILSTGDDAILIDIKQRLRMLKGDDIFNKDAGIDVSLLQNKEALNQKVNDIIMQNNEVLNADIKSTQGDKGIDLDIAIKTKEGGLLYV